jgi:type 1 glutamine amidotransferase
MNLPRLLSLTMLLLVVSLTFGEGGAPGPLVYPGGEGPGKGKHVVLIAGDEEYRSEEMLPQLGRILSKHHGFKCTVLFSLNKTGEIDPKASNIPGLEALASADLMILFVRFRHLPDEQMKHIADYVGAGKPVLGIRTATHAFSGGKGKYADWNWSNAKGGFGRQVLGETWVNHHGGHGSQATRGIIAPKMSDHPILKGIKDGDIFGPSDVYTVKLPLPGDCKPLVLGQVVAGMKPTDKALPGKKNDPMMPIAWITTYTPEKGKPARVFTSTMGCAQDFENEGYRRLLVNASYWCVGLEEQIPAKSKVDIVGKYKASPFGNDRFQEGLKPSHYKLD